MSLPTKGERFASLTEHLRLAQEDAAMLSHLYADESRVKSEGWLKVSELLKQMLSNVISLATRGLQ